MAKVTPLAGVWVEIPTAYEPYTGGRPSLPLRECGLKWGNGEILRFW